MGHEQKRRSLSLHWTVYQRLEKMCRDDGRSVSGYVTELLNEKMDERGRAIEVVREPKPGKMTSKGPASSGVRFF